MSRTGGSNAAVAHVPAAGGANPNAHGVRKDWDKVERVLAAAVAYRMGCAHAGASVNEFTVSGAKRGGKKLEWRFGDWTHWQQSVTVTGVPNSVTPRPLAMALLGGSTLEACGVTGFDVRDGLASAFQRGVGGKTPGCRTHIFWFGDDQDTSAKLAHMRAVLAAAVADGGEIAGLRGAQLRRMRVFPRRDPQCNSGLTAAVETVQACREQLDKLVENAPHVVDEVLATMGWQAASDDNVQLGVVAEVAMTIAAQVRQNCEPALEQFTAVNQRGEGAAGDSNGKRKPAAGAGQASQRGKGGPAKATGGGGQDRVPAGQAAEQTRRGKPAQPSVSPPADRPWLRDGVSAHDVYVKSEKHAWCKDKKWLRRHEMEVLLDGERVTMDVEMPLFIDGLLHDRRADDKRQLILTFARMATLLFNKYWLAVVGNEGLGDGDCLFQAMSSVLCVHGHPRSGDDAMTCRQRCIDALVAEIQKQDKGVLALWWELEVVREGGCSTVQQAIDKFNTARAARVWYNGMDSLFVMGLELAYDCRLRVHTVAGDWERRSPDSLELGVSHRAGEDLGARGYHLLNFPGKGHYEALAEMRPGKFAEKCWLAKQFQQHVRGMMAREAADAMNSDVGDTEPDSDAKSSGVASKSTSDATDGRRERNVGPSAALADPIAIASVQLKPGTFVAREGQRPAKQAAKKPAGVKPVDTGQLSKEESEELKRQKRLQRVRNQLGVLGALGGGAGPVGTSGSGSSSRSGRSRG